MALVNTSTDLRLTSGIMVYPKCPGRIRFGFQTVEREGATWFHSTMVVECCGHKGHDGPHIHKVEAVAEYEDPTIPTIDHPFTITWTEHTS